MNFFDFCADFLAKGPVDENGRMVIPAETGSTTATQLHIEEQAIFSVIDLLASAASLCRWRFYQDGKRVESRDSYRWNVRPNPYQTGTEFKRLLFARLFLFNQALIIDRGGGYYIADSFCRTADGFSEPTYDAISVNGVTLDRQMRDRDVIYIRLALSPQAVKLRQNLNGLYSQMAAEGFDKYKKSGGKSGILKVNGIAEGRTNFESEFETLMNDRFKTFFANKNAVLPIFDGYEYIPQNGPAAQKSTSEVSDMDSLLKQAQVTACNAWHVAPSLLRGEVTGLQEAIDSTLTFALKPALRAVSDAVNNRVYGEKVLDGWCVSISMAGMQSVNPFSVADKVDKLVADRIYHPDGIRELLDDEPIGEDWAKTYTVTKNLETVTGGNGNGEN